MPTTVNLPFGGLNQVPGVSGVEDVSFTIPQLGDIQTAIVRNTLGRTDVDDKLVEFIGDSGDDLITILGQGVDLSDDAIAEFVEAVEGATGVDVPGDGSVLDGVADVTLGREDVEDIIREGVMDVLDDVSPDNVDVRIDGIFGPLSEDVAGALEDIVGFDPDQFLDDVVAALEESLGIDVPGEGPLLESVPTLDEIDQTLTDGLDGLSPDIDGVEFWSDPLGFLERLWDEIAPLLLSEESAANLQQALEDMD